MSDSEMEGEVTGEMEALENQVPTLAQLTL